MALRGRVLWTSGWAALVAIWVVLTLVFQVGGVAQASVPHQPKLWSPGSLPPQPSTKGRDAPARRMVERKRPNEFAPAVPAWPAAASGEVELATPALLSPLIAPQPTPLIAQAGAGMSGAHEAGVPLWVASAGILTAGVANSAVKASRATRQDVNAVAAAPTPSRVRMAVTSRTVAHKAGVDGLLVSLQRTDGMAAARVSVRLDYSAIRDAFGGDYASRLHLVSLPACVLTTPEVDACRAQTPVTASANLVGEDALVADVTLPKATPSAEVQAAQSQEAQGTAGVLVLAAAAGDSGGAGTYAATSLNPAGKWGAGGNTGSFTYSYPVAVPPSVGGGAPAVKLAYNSANVDGRTSATNNQASWVGDGWEYTPGFIERSYRACANDGEEQANGDMCWAGDNASLSLNGSNSELVPIGTHTDGVYSSWRLAEDNGSRIDELTGAANGVDSGTYWRVTTRDGTQYFFGAYHLPDSAGGDGTDASTYSAWDMPVYGNDAGEPCHEATLAASTCAQGWRWNLDFVVDPHKNLTVYTYSKERNYYAAGSDHTLTAYVRGGYPTKIAYGWQVADYVAKTVTNSPAKVTFTVAERCDGKSSFDCSTALSSSTASHWPDVPYDLNCASTGTCTTYAPSFWSTKRLTTIATSVWDTSLTTAAYRTVDTYALANQSFPDPGDGSKPAMWLQGITHTGNDTGGGGSAASVPQIKFTGTAQLPNRVEGLVPALPPINRLRLQALTTETGSQITVTYNTPSCSRSNPPSEDDNGALVTGLCYPVRWTPPNFTDPILDWFYKYTVAEVDQSDQVNTASTPLITTYQYVGKSAWHRDDNELTVSKNRTWGEFRGFGEVITRSGRAPDPVTQSHTFYLRGMAGDLKADGSTKSDPVTNTMGETVPDDDAFAGFVYQTVTDSGSGGSARTQTFQTPWKSPATAAHNRAFGLPDQIARFTGTSTTRSRDLLSSGKWRTVQTHSTFDEATGLVTSVDDKGEVDDSGDPVGGSTTPRSCTLTSYASDTDRNMVGFPAETTTVAGDCSTPADATHTLAQSRTFYGTTTLGQIAATNAGDVTATQAVHDYSGPTARWTTATKTVYDTYGRVTSNTDAMGRTTGTAYNPVGSKYLPTSTVTTNPKTWTATNVLDVARSLPIKTTDVNGLIVTLTYDGLGRLTNVWLPNRPATQSASMRFTYSVSASAPSTVKTETLHDGDIYTVDYKIYDSLLRVRQEQSTPPDGGSARVISDTRYDSAGRTILTSAGYHNSASAPTGAFFTAVDSTVPQQSRTIYDGMGRAVSQATYSNANLQWATTISYPGMERADVTPPSGGTATTTITDGRGKRTELWQYHGGTPVGDTDVTTYHYDALGRSVGVTDAKNNVWATSYDQLGNAVSSTDPDTGGTSSSYDDIGELLTTTDNRGQTLSYVYDNLGRKTEQHDGPTTGPKLAAWTYDAATLGKGLPSSSIAFNSSGATRYTSSIAGYTNLGKPKDTTITIPASAAKNTAAITYKTTNTYTTNSQLLYTSKIEETGAGSLLPTETVGYAYNLTGLPVASGGTNTYVAWMDYTHLGQPMRATMGVVPSQVAQTYTYDAFNRVAGYNFDRQNGTSSVDNVSYTRNAAGQITSIADIQGGSSSTTTDRQCYRYDYLGRLTDAWTDTGGVITSPSPTIPGIGGCTHTTPAAANLGGPAPYWQSYAYDLIGNRTSRTDHSITGNSAQDVVTAEEYDLPGDPDKSPHAVRGVTVGTGPEASYSYDPAGNLVGVTNDDSSKDRQITWGKTGKIDTLKTGPSAAPTHTAGYIYDPDGNLLARTDDATTTLFLGGDQLTISGGTASQAVRYYTFPGAPTVVRKATSSASSALSYQANNVQGTATTEVTSTLATTTRRNYSPFGELRGTAPTWTGGLGFVGGTKDTITGLTNLGAREYDPSLGRFISVDPLFDTSDPQSWNGYAYANNSPITNSDPSGLRLCQDSCAPGEDWVDDRGGYHEGTGSNNGGNNTASNSGSGGGSSSSGSSHGGSSTCGAGCKVGGGASDALNGFDWGFWDTLGIIGKPVVALAEWDLDSTTWEDWGKWQYGERRDNFWSGVGSGTFIAATAVPTGGESAIVRGSSATGRAVEDMAAGGGGHGIPCSFTPSTLVLMADGKTKPIADINVGDHVEAADPDTGHHQGPHTVTATIVNHDYDLIDLDVRQADGRVTTVHTTSKHPFWDDTQHAWIPAGQLTPGDSLNTAADQHVVVARVKVHPGDRDMYNLTVAELHTYYVLADATPVLVHNCDEFIDFAHGTTTAHAENIAANGLNSAAAKAASNGGKVAQPGRFFTYRVSGGGDPNLSTAAQWGVTRNGGARDGASVVITRMCKCTYDRLVQEGHITTRVTGEGMPEETIFGPGALSHLEVLTHFPL
ncbi:type IV secretion protein Rhs [Planotetraspora silvatica]|uniref:Type IV secretion protein Rhs n=1 Tax=Planotetraspora silvatica TaxID=234614 RepID=A0A8J3UT42_9ACTN|nr:polymorphic toxin-type HINT domain-containing protein [Planotetraspora silvatica]GII50837.1 type IV secretion protein Rhs [Planotetraspora silvatica]